MVADPIILYYSIIHYLVAVPIISIISIISIICPLYSLSKNNIIDKRGKIIPTTTPVLRIKFLKLVFSNSFFFTREEITRSAIPKGTSIAQINHIPNGAYLNESNASRNIMILTMIKTTITQYFIFIFFSLLIILLLRWIYFCISKRPNRTILPKITLFSGCPHYFIISPIISFNKFSLQSFVHTKE